MNQRPGKAFTSLSINDTYRCEILLSNTSNTDLGFHQFWREPRIVQKQAIPRLKGLIQGSLYPEDWGRGILIGLPRPLFMINCIFFGKGGMASQ